MKRLAFVFGSAFMLLGFLALYFESGNVGVERTFDIIRQIRGDGVTVVMVEQNAYAALELSDRAYVLEQGRVALAGLGAELLDNPHVKQAYLGT